MKSFAKFISKYLASFMGLILLLLFVNIVAFAWTFFGVVTKDYGEYSPSNMFEKISKAVTLDGIEEQSSQSLSDNHIWAIYLDMDGNIAWSFDAPSEIPARFTIQDIAVLAKGYLADYPVFIRNKDDGMLILGYPKGSYTKLIGNYFSGRTLRTLPFFVIGILAIDLVIIFLAYYFSKQKILKSTEPIISSIETLGSGKPVSVSVDGELSGVANSINRASYILSRQNQARANWISGVSHDIRTPLSMIMGYAERIKRENGVEAHIRTEAEIIERQGVKIKELVQDLNLVSQLEYEMQPIRKDPVRLSGLLRSYTAELLNAGLSDSYSVEIEILPEAETIVFECDARLISRAINNLVQNSIRHNPDGCTIKLSLSLSGEDILLSVSDNGVGMPEEKIHEIEKKPHYIESTDDRLDLRHGLGLILVRQIVAAHNGHMRIHNEISMGCKVVLQFSTETP